jgi:hypothetical protein
MLQDTEWIELLDYLLSRLDERGANSVANEIRTAVSTRIVERHEERQESDIPASYYREVGKTMTRLPTPKEAVMIALGVIQNCLVVIPSIAERASIRLQRGPDRIIWRRDDEGHLSRLNDKPLSASVMVLSSSDRQQISDLLQQLGELIKES